MKAVNKLELIIARDFSKSPGPRDKEEGDFSGEQFREEVLLPKLHEAQSKGCVLLVDLDGTAGYGTSFLEEAFGGLIRNNGLSLKVIKDIVRFKSGEEEYLIDDIMTYMGDAENEKTA